MSINQKYFFLLLYLLISLSYSNDNFNEKIKILNNNCSEDIYKDLTDEKNFTYLVKMNFQSFLCKLYREIYKGDKFNDLFQDVKNINECLDNIINSFHNDSDFYYKYLLYSGSSLNKIGNEKSCFKDNLTYVFIEMYTDYSKTEKEMIELLNNETYQKYNISNDIYQNMELNVFLENDKFYLGLCLWRKCRHFYEKFFHRDNNSLLFEYLSNYSYNAQNWTYYIREKNKKPSYSPSIVLSIIIIIFILFIRIILCISKYCTERTQRKEAKVFKLNSFSPSPEEIQLYEQNLEYQENIVYDNVNKENKDKDSDNNIDNNEKDQNDELIRINSKDKIVPVSDSETRTSQVSSLLSNRKTQAEIFLEHYQYITFDNLYKLETKSYNSKNFEEICGLKFFMLFGISFYNVYNTFYVVKWNNPGTISFYKDTTHILLAKLSKMSFRVWIFFDGFQWCFKLFSYIHKLKSENVRFKHIMIFSKNLIEKIIVFIVIFFIFIYQFQYFGDIFNLTSSFYMHYKKYTNAKCYNNPLYILILPLIGYFEEIGKYEYCFNFVYILMNELYAIIICSILFFLFFKYRSKKLEYSFLLIFLFSIILLFVHFLNDNVFDKNKIVEIENKKPVNNTILYKKRFVLGEDLSHKSILLFFHYFFIGCISGLVYYYSTVMNLDLEKYNTFEICYRFMYCYLKMKKFVRHCIALLCLFLIMVICSYYPILCKLYFSKYDFKLIIEIGFYTRLLISYENIIQIILFTFFFFDIKLSSEIFTKLFLSNDIFIIFERCCFVFLIINEQIVFLFETLMYLDGIYWNTENIIFLSIICFLITLLISIPFVFFIQLPLRLLIKKDERESLENYEQNN